MRRGILCRLRIRDLHPAVRFFSLFRQVDIGQCWLQQAQPLDLPKVRCFLQKQVRSVAYTIAAGAIGEMKSVVVTTVQYLTAWQIWLPHLHLLPCPLSRLFASLWSAWSAWSAYLPACSLFIRPSLSYFKALLNASVSAN